MDIKKLLRSTLFILSMHGVVHAMVYDNRYLPLFKTPYSRTTEKPSSFIMNPMIMIANDVFNDDDKTSGLPDLLGVYDQQKVSHALLATGKPSPFASNPLFATLQGDDVLWLGHGKLQAEGFAFTWNQKLRDYFYLSASWFFLHATSRYAYTLSNQIKNVLGNNQATITALDEARREMNNELGIVSERWDGSGFSDIDFALRVGNIWNYPYKFRRIDFGLSAGVMIPTGVQRELNNPASIPFGGDGFWGLYMALDGEFELKEDWSLGFLLRMDQRLQKTKIIRMPAAKEQPLFGAIIGKAKISPGFTFIASPYVRLEEIRNGLGLMVEYLIGIHDNDLFQDRRENRRPEALVHGLYRTSAWSSEYVNVNLFYDFGKILVHEGLRPLITFICNVPVRFLIADDVPKTYRVMLGIEFDF